MDEEIERGIGREAESSRLEDDLRSRSKSSDIVIEEERSRSIKRRSSEIGEERESSIRGVVRVVAEVSGLDSKDFVSTVLIHIEVSPVRGREGVEGMSLRSSKD